MNNEQLEVVKQINLLQETIDLLEDKQEVLFDSLILPNDEPTLLSMIKTMKDSIWRVYVADKLRCVRNSNINLEEYKL